MNGAVQKEVSVLINSSSAESRDVDLSAVDYLYIQYMAGNEKNICMTYCDNENNLKMCLMDIETGKLVYNTENANLEIYLKYLEIMF